MSKEQIDLTKVGDIKILNVMDPKDFSWNLVFNGGSSLKMTLEQWEGFVKEVMALWANRGGK
jgi:hypothetical protein